MCDCECVCVCDVLIVVIMLKITFTMTLVKWLLPLRVLNFNVCFSFFPLSVVNSTNGILNKKIKEHYISTFSFILIVDFIWHFEYDACMRYVRECDSDLGLKENSNVIHIKQFFMRHTHSHTVAMWFWYLIIQLVGRGKNILYII